MAKILGIVSGKGGTGKTVTSLNIALALHEFGEDVIVVDADTTASTMGIHLGLYMFPNNLQDVLNENIDISRAIYMHQTGLKFIPSSIDLELLDADVSKMRLALNKLDATIIVDSPAGLDKGAISIFIVTNPEMPTVANGAKISRMARDMKKNIFGVIITRVKNNGWELTPEDIETMCETSVIGIVPEDMNVKKSIFEKVPVVANVPYSPASIEYKKIAARLLGKTYEPPKHLALKKFLRLI